MTSSFYVLDFDRTLVDTDKLYVILEKVLERDTNIGMRDLNEEKAVIEADGDSFSIIESLRRLLADSNSSVDWLDVQQAFINEARQTDVLEPYAAELLKLLDDKQLPYGIITFGNEAWQLAKIEAAGLTAVPHVVTNIKEKGQLLSGWKHDSNDSFIIPPAMTRNFDPLVVDSIIFLDDKPVSFSNLPSGVHGVLVKSPTRALLPSQRGTLPSTVSSVTGINGAIELLFQ